MFDVKTINLGAGSYLRTNPKNALEKEQKENKDNYFQNLLYYKSNFTQMVYSDYVIPIMEALVEQRSLALNMIFKLKWE